MESSPDTLTAALTACGIELPEPQVATLALYCQLLWEWNQKLNLTRHQDYVTFAARDVVDSLALAEFLKPSERILDVGSGGGVPGVVLAVVRPDLDVSLCESVAKKARALEDIVERMDLRAVVHHARAEDLLASQHFDTLTVRAVAPLRKLLTWFHPHWNAFGRLLLIKGRTWLDDRAEARHHGLLKDLALRCLKTYTTPGTDAQSVLLQICPRERFEDDARPRKK